MERSPPGGWKVLFKNSLFYARRPMVSVLEYPGGIYLHVWQQLYMWLVPWGCDTFWSGGTRGTNVASYRGWCEKITKELGTRKKERLKRTWEKNAFLIFFWQPAIAAPRPFRSSKYILGFCDQNQVMYHCRNQGWQGDKKVWKATSIWGSFYFGMWRFLQNAVQVTNASCLPSKIFTIACCRVMAYSYHTMRNKIGRVCC